jgi:OOP family OmpA-OmpF porin
MNMGRLAILGIALMIFSGCSTIKSDRTLCIATGALIGGAGTAAADNDEDYALVGAAAGAVIAYFVCEGDEDGDGVADESDRCPGTPRGIAVDANGCPADSDGDGVYDYQDACPQTPAGVAVDTQGCPLDSDGDGVPDHRDTCPNSPAGSVVDERGCAPDSDMDGVPDSADQCPNTARGKSVDSKGCHITLRLTGLNFALNSAELSDTAKQRVTDAAATLKQEPNLRIRVEGHTDDTGTGAYNQQLSERRAKAVVDYLIGQGVAAGRLESRGYGEPKPIAPNDTREGRAKNRRVDFAVIES